MAGKRITQKDIAAKAGVDRSTVSLALRNHYSISVAMRERIKTLAQKMGYKPDPMLTALSQYRQGLTPRGFQGTIAWLVNGKKNYGLNSPHYYDYYQGAIKGSQKHGFSLEAIFFNQETTTSRRLEQILRTRNIHGILLAPQRINSHPLNLRWELFSLITFGYSLTSPPLHTVTSTHFRSARRVLAILRERGYKRIGLAISTVFETRCDWPYMAAYACEFMKGGKAPPCPPLLVDLLLTNIEHFYRWLLREKPDAVLVNDYRVISLLRQHNFPIPKDIAFTCSSMPFADGVMAGVVENSIHIGEVAVDLLVAMMHRGECGIPSFPQRTHVEGEWVEGDSIRCAAPSLSIKKEKQR